MKGVKTRERLPCTRKRTLLSEWTVKDVRSQCIQVANLLLLEKLIKRRVSWVNGTGPSVKGWKE